MNIFCIVVNINIDGRLIVVWLNEKVMVDYVISGILVQIFVNILLKDWEGLVFELKNICNIIVGVVNLEYEGSVMFVEGFGYLVFFFELFLVFGIIFDFCVFFENDRCSGKIIRIIVSVSQIWIQFDVGKQEGGGGGVGRRLFLEIFGG